MSDTRDSYDTDAAGYAEKVAGLLGESPCRRASLALFAELVHRAGGGSVAGMLAFWSTIQVPDHAMPVVFEQFRRVLRPEGPLLVGFHVGDETQHRSESYTGQPINVDSHRRRPGKLAGRLRDAGCTIEGELVIRPDEDVPGAVVFARNNA